ncbi:uncharacterized protein LOC130636749 [Hydractinia symbiolongicarpus]|uniref:uncharacterized protein LOC130636749 n=1 Tax=Hydractinia symbiolongicarpus TaxID=13093 RepID=UPI00254E15FF|nr:uncharacterized protein LOC130636749 [Hydractinia symbiolongicarpus]XP_057302565.1 uncharacterized protein LOC130636749 [Hydractinia symbiolongicarpus]
MEVAKCLVDPTNSTVRNMTDNSTLCNISPDVNFEATLLFALLYILSYTLLTAVLILYAYGDKKDLGVHCNMGLIFFAFLVSTIAELSFQESEKLTYSISTTIVVFVFGIGVTFVASFYFFDIRRSAGDLRVLGHGHENIADFLWTITKIVVLLELFLLIGSLVKYDYLAAIFVFSGFFQKICQAWLYKYSLQYKIPAKNKFCGASWYLKIVALFNFSMWLDSIMTADLQGDHFIKSILSDSYSIFSSGYAALLIDYRLLCCILFVEHAIKIDGYISEKQNNEATACRPFTPADELDHDTVEASEEFKHDTSLLAGGGFLCGMVLLSLQIINGLQYKYLGPWTNIFGIIADFTTMVCGFFIIRKVKSAKIGKDTLFSVGIDILMASMGICGVLFWCLKGTLASTWAARSRRIPHNTAQYDYLCWNAIKFWCKPFSIVYQIYVFVKLDFYSACSDSMKRRKINHFLFPLLMLGFLSVFLNAIIDAYTGIIETLAKNSKMNILYLTVYQCGSPLHLGFCLHLFLHFYTINGKLTRSRKAGTTSPRPPPPPTTTKPTICKSLLQHLNTTGGQNQACSKDLDEKLQPLLDGQHIA